MKISILLHFYQPYNQQQDILLRIVNESYLPITRGLLKRPKAKLTININGALLELLSNNGYNEVLENIKTLVQRSQVELLGSAKYHAFLPLLPKEEIYRQIISNEEILKKHFGEVYYPKGFFSPEMAVDNNVLESVKSLGFDWIAVPQLSFPTGDPSTQIHYVDQKTGIKLLFRNKRISSVILSAVCRDAKDLINETRDLHDKDAYWFCVMDAETFGHHRIGHEKLLFDLAENDFFEFEKATDLLKLRFPQESTTIRPSTWTNQEQDFWVDKEKNIPDYARSFILWKEPDNPIHSYQWELTNLAIETVNQYEDKASQNYVQARDLLDRAVSSDQYWWASAKPWWSLEMVEQGAHELKQVLLTLNPSNTASLKAEELYRKIIDQAFEWQRSGYIRKRHLDNSGTFMKPALKDRTNPEWLNQLILEFEYDMNGSIMRQDFEKAIKWRDAVIKIGLGTDIYDVLHVLDELWMGRNTPWAQPQVKPFLEHNWDEFSDFAKGHFIGVHSAQEFEDWKYAKKIGKEYPVKL